VKGGLRTAFCWRGMAVILPVTEQPTGRRAALLNRDAANATVGKTLFPQCQLPGAALPRRQQ